MQEVAVLQGPSSVTFGRGSTGGIVNQEALIDVSNVALIDPETHRPARVGFRADGEAKIRVTRPGGKDI